jgi:hypothetical protein
MIKANAVMRHANKTEEVPPIRDLCLDVDQFNSSVRATLRMEDLEIRELNQRRSATLGNINF